MLERITNDIKEAMKSKDTLRLQTLRMLKGSIDLERINKKLEKVSDEDIIVIIGKQIKTRKESIVEFEKGNRQDLIDQTNEEIKILSSYMPEQLSEEKIIDIIDHIIKTVNATSIKDMGSVMKEASSKLKGKADMSLVSSIIKNKLN
ncbi:MAG: GatB/YqeY domain-containing protein [Bacilli bacterium]|nr:GatB/YqeY domain-containing protein [Bacilli bacterium]